MGAGRGGEGQRPPSFLRLGARRPEERALSRGPLDRGVTAGLCGGSVASRVVRGLGVSIDLLGCLSFPLRYSGSWRLFLLPTGVGPLLGLKDNGICT